MSDPIIISNYNTNWPHLFNKEAELIKSVIEVINIHHVGSTAIPELSAKPIIDMIVVVKDRDKTIFPLEKLGYKFKGEYNIPFRSYFNKEGIHLHMYEENHPEIELNICFRDFLRSNSFERLEYEKLKRRLANEKEASLKKGMFSAYTLGKDAFIKACLQKACYKGVRFLKATHTQELEFIRKFNEPDPLHHHFVLYEGIEVIGYGRIDPNISMISTFVKNEWRNHFRELLLNWANKEFYGGRCEKQLWSFNRLE